MLATFKKSMKKLLFFLLAFLLSQALSAQTISFKGTVYDAVAYIPVKAANILNLNTGKYQFTNAEGVFIMNVSLHDTLIISTSTYRQKVVIIDEKMYKKGHEDILLYHKAFMLQEVRVVALNPTYEGFKRDIANAKLPDSYKNLEGIHLTKEDKFNATYKEEPNILKNTAIGSPISFLYSKFNKHEKTKRLFYEMQGYGDEVQQVPIKYNREIVSKITGLSGKDLMEFMVFCRFSYYDLVRWDSNEIISAIRYKFSEYQYYKALEEEE